MYRLLAVGVLRLADSVVITRSHPGWQDYRAWLKKGNAPLPMEPPPVIEPTLAEVKAAKIRQIRTDALAALNAYLPDATDTTTLILLRELYLSIAPVARKPTAAWSTLLAIYQTMRTSIDAVRACGTAACVETINPTWP